MSLFGAFDMDDDPFFGSHMRTMRQMNNMMNSLFADPFGLMGGAGAAGFVSPLSPRQQQHHHHHHHHQSAGGSALMPTSASMPMMPSAAVAFNRLLSGSLDGLMGAGVAETGGGGYSSSSSSTIVSMTSAGPDGRPQVYKATSSTRCGPGGVKETQRTVSDSMTGTKKMAIGHHIGDRAHIIEKEQNMHTGDREEREELINLDDDDKDEFNNEWENKTRGHHRPDLLRITGANRNSRHSYGGGHGHALPALTAGPSRRNRERQTGTPLVSSRRGIRSSPLAGAHANSGAMSKPYSPPVAQPAPVRKSKNIKTVNGSPLPPPDM